MLSPQPSDGLILETRLVGRTFAQIYRKSVAMFMTPDQFDEAQRQTREWMAKHQQ